MKPSSKRKLLFPILSLLPPLLWFLMYAPIWGGRELKVYDSTEYLLIIQAVCLCLAALHLLLVLRNRDRRWMGLLFGLSFALSLMLLCFFGLAFCLDLAGVEFLPAQSAIPQKYISVEVLL